MKNSRITAPLVALSVILSFFAGSIIGPQAVGMHTAWMISLAIFSLPGLALFGYFVRRFNFLLASFGSAVLNSLAYIAYWSISYEDFDFSFYSVPLLSFYFFIISIFFFALLQLAFFRKAWMMRATEDLLKERSAAETSLFSAGALVGSTFAGLWSGGWLTAILLGTCANGSSPSLVGILGAAGVGALLSMVAAVIYVLSGSVVVAMVVFPLARWARGRLSPTISNAAKIGAAIGLALAGAVMIFGTGSAESLLIDISLALGCLAGATMAGLVYRAMLVYRRPELLSLGTEPSVAGSMTR